jgi:hypothetical protein
MDTTSYLYTLLVFLVGVPDSAKCEQVFDLPIDSVKLRVVGPKACKATDGQKVNVMTYKRLLRWLADKVPRQDCLENELVI